MQKELLKEAQTIVEERRSSVVLGIQGEPGRDGVFQWVSGPPTAGKTALLAYNKNSGALRTAQVTALPLLQPSFECVKTLVPAQYKLPAFVYPLTDWQGTYLYAIV